MISVCPRFLVRLLVLLAVLIPVSAQAALTVTPITWNIVGLDSNDVNTGPNDFPVGVRVCSNVATTNVNVTFVWDSANALINLRPGSLSTINIPSIGAGMCADAYFEVTVTRNAAAFDTTRLYHITATDFTGTYSSPTPREIYVEHLISQNRNSISDVQFGPVGGPYTSVAPGGSMNLVVGNTYDIRLIGGTATQGYNQFEEFINFPNTIFQILDVETSYSADNSPYVPNPNDKLYADACLWDNDPNSPNYRSCIGGDFKAGGSTVITTYTIRIVSGGGTSQPLTSLLYDFSGSSFHYNSDYATSARIATIIDPTTATISKSFFPNPAALNGVSTLTFTLANPNGGVLGGYNFVDNLPANLVVAATPSVSISGCGAPTVTANAGSSTISFSNGTVGANSTCVISVNVTPTALGSLNNTTNNLFIGATDTGDNASATLTVNNAPPPGTGLCGQTLARWLFPTGFNTTTPAASTANVTASASAGNGLPALMTGSNSTTTADGTLSWRGNGGFDNTAALLAPNTTLHDYFEFVVNSSGYTSLNITFDVQRTANGPRGIAVYSGNAPVPAAPPASPDPGTQNFNNTNLLTNTNWFTVTTPVTINTSGNTYIRVYGYLANQTNPGADLSIDNVHITGCGPAMQPTIAKSFSPDPIAVNGVSTLTFTLTNTNSVALTGAAFTDNLPSGVQVAATPSATTTCAGAWSPAAGSTALVFAAGTIPASGSCIVAVNVTATTAGPHANTGGFLSTTESGTNTSSIPSDTLTALLPPVIGKQFNPSPILPNTVSTLTFTITNPNVSDPLASVAFSDTLPSSPAQMQVAPLPNASVSGCGAPTFAPSPGSTSLTFTGGTLAPGGICTITVDVVVPAVGTYNNTSGNVSTVINGNTVNGNTASSSLEAVPPSPSISLGKQVSLSASGPWTSFVAVTGSAPVFYLFTIENTGDVPLSPISITDDTLNVSTCNSALASTILPPPVPANDNHIVTCVVGPVATTPGSHTNTAHATGTYAGNPVDSPDDSATYATTGLTLDKTVVQTTFTAAGNTLNYNYLVTNSGFAPLQGPVTVADDKTTVTCPAVTTVGDLDNFLDPGESITCTASYIVTAGDVTAAFVTNTATATVQGVNSNSDSTTVFLATSADVSIVKTLTTAGPYTSGQSITYTLTVANAGPSTATNVQVTDTPTNLSITSVSSTNCAALPCTIPSLAMNASEVITVTATITAPGAFDNVANVTATQPDPVPANNTDNTGNNGVTGPSADVSIVKTLVTNPPYFHGQTITYTLLVANAGPSTATNVQVTDTDTNLTIQTVSSTNCAALPCTIPSLAMNASELITVTATIDAPGPFDNVASANATETDPNPGNNTDNAGNGGTADPSADVSVTKDLSTPPPFTVGQTITYTITVLNSGPSAANNIVVNDTPSNLTITSVSSTNCSSFPCTIPILGLLNSEIITVQATINGAGIFNNSTTVSADEPDPNVSNNTDNTGNSGNAGAQADVAVAKTLVTAGPFLVGQTIIYSIVVTNNGPQPATNINVTDTPSNLTITSVSSTNCAALPCTIPLLNPTNFETITVTATINAAGAFDNSVTVAATETDPVPGNNTDNTGNGGTAVAPSADVAVTKTLNTAGPYIIGQTIQYTIAVTNNGPQTATNIQVTDTPANLTITSVSSTNCAALPCTIPSLAMSVTENITVMATINAVGAFDNSVTVSATPTDPVPGNNTDNTGNGGTAVASADVLVTKTLNSAGPFHIGDSVSYTIHVQNNGPSTATNIQVTDTPTNLTITGVSSASCAALPCTIPSLTSGSFEDIAVTATITAVGTFDNSVTVAATESDPNTNNNTDSTGNSGSSLPAADVSIVKTLVTAGPYNVGQSVQYTLDVSNAGPSVATNVQVTDTPTNLTITSVSGSGCATLPCTIPSISAPGTTQITVTATINSTGVFNNSATATPAEFDPDTGDNTDNTNNGGTTGAAADVSVLKSIITAPPYYQGSSIQFLIVVANGGPDTATNVTVTDTPSGVTITNVSGGGCTSFPCIIPSLANGASVNITVTATITVVGAFDNATAVSATEFDPNTNNNSDNAGNGGTSTALADVSIVKTLVTGGPYSAGQSIQYTLNVANAGPSTATTIQVTDTPTNLTITNVTGSGCAALPCVIASLASGASTQITVTATITAAGAFDNSATAMATQTDPNLANNTDSIDNGGTAGAAATVDLALTKTGPAQPVNVGQQFDFILTLTNNGPGTATNVVVNDPLPSNFALTSATSTQGLCSGTTTVTCTVGTMLSGATVTITIRGSATSGGQIVNTATASATETETVTANNTSTAIALAAGYGDTLSDIALMLLVMLLAGVGVGVMKMRM